MTIASPAHVAAAPDAHQPVGIARGAHYFPELECLRGVAIALVVLFHADGIVRLGNTKGMWPPLPLALLLGGHTGVSLFFVLSGFLLALPFLAEVDGERRVDRRLYYRKRALRILPIYWAVLALGVVVTVRSLDDLLPRLGYFVFLNSVPTLVTQMPPFTNPVWSLATEVQFYAVLPLLALCFRSRRRLAALLLLLSLLYLAMVYGRLGRPPVRDFLVNGVVGRFPQFGVGIAVAWLYRRRRAQARGPLLGRGAADLAVLACLVVLALLLRPVVHDAPTAWNLPPRCAWHIPEGVCWAILLLVVLEGRLLLRPLLVNRPLARLGILSYSIYLLHMPVFWYSTGVARRAFELPVGWSLGNLAWLLAALAAILALSELTYRLIERPFLERKARLQPAARRHDAATGAVDPGTPR